MKKLAYALLFAGQLAIIPSMAFTAPSPRDAAISQQEQQKLTAAKEEAAAIIFAQYDLRLNSTEDTQIRYALSKIRHARNEKDVTRAFETQQAQPFLGFDDLKAIVATGDKYFKGVKIPARYGAMLEGTRIVADLGSQLEKLSLENKEKGVRINSLPALYSSTTILADMPSRPPEVRWQAAIELAKRMGKNPQEILDAVVKSRASGGNSKAYNAIVADEIATIKRQFVSVKNDLQAQIAKTTALEARQRRRDDAAVEDSHYRATIYLSGQALRPFVGDGAAGKLTGIASELVNVRTTYKQFGPNGAIRPDNLIMFTNFVTAAVAVAGILQSENKQDQVTVMLRGIMDELQAIKKMLKQLDEKIDDLTNLTLTGFERLLASQEDIKAVANQILETIRAQESDRVQEEALMSFAASVRTNPYKAELAQDCAKTVPIAVARTTCLNYFVDFLSDRTFTGTLADQDRRVPGIISPTWSNPGLSATDSFRRALRILSYPRYIARANPVYTNAMLAYNQEAIDAFAKAFMLGETFDVQHAPANPDVLLRAVHLLLQIFGKNPELTRDPVARGVSEQAIERINEIQKLMDTTIGSTTALERLWDVMASDIREFESAATNAANDIGLNGGDVAGEERQRDWEEFVRRFNAGVALNSKITQIEDCGPNAAFGTLSPAPYDDKTKQGMEKFVDPIFWVAEGMRLGMVAQCYTTYGADQKTAYGLWFNNSHRYEQQGYRVKVFFNPATQGSTFSANEATGNVRLTPASRLIADRSYTTKRYYRYNPGASALGVLPRTWNSFVDSVHSLCHPSTPCEGEVVAYEALVTESKDLDTAHNGDVTKERVYSAVRGKWVGFIKSVAPIWDPLRLRDISVEDPNILSKSTSEKLKNDLSVSMKAFSEKYYFAENLIMLSSFHGSPLPRCMQTLNEYSPEKLSSMVIERTMPEKGSKPTSGSIADQFREAMSKVTDRCHENPLRPDLVDARDALKQILASR